MHPEPEKLSVSEKILAQRFVSGGDLVTLFEAQRLATQQLHAGLRNWLAASRDVLQTPPPQEHTRTRAHIDKAFELSRQAEAKIELVVSRFGDRQ